MSKFMCTYCQKTVQKWAGQCFSCKQWNTIELYTEKLQPTKDFSKYLMKNLETDLKPNSVPLKGLFSKILGCEVFSTNYLLYGEPGGGKSSLSLHLLKELNVKTLYISGEESSAQILQRFNRHNIPMSNVYLSIDTDVKAILKLIAGLGPRLIIIDSIQTLSCRDNLIGKSLHVREALDQLTAIDAIVWIIGHVNKKGSLAGPKYLEHMVDVVLELKFESDGIRSLCTKKNRYGSSEKKVLFSLEKNGVGAVSNLNRYKIFSSIGKTAFVTADGGVGHIEVLPRQLREFSIEGITLTRFNFVKSQVEQAFKNKRISAGFYVSLMGKGHFASDLSLFVAMCSSLLKASPPDNYLFWGVIGLNGEISLGVSLKDIKNLVAQGLGPTTLVGPAGLNQFSSQNIRVISVSNIDQVKKEVFSRVA